MPAGSNRGSGGGSNLRILWIPGRKRHDKGIYQPTNKGIDHNKHTPKKIEPWSFGGPKEHDEGFTKTDVTEEATSSMVSTSILPTASIGAVAIDAELDDEEDEAKKNKEKSEIGDKDKDNFGCSSAAGSSTGSPTSGGYDTATLLISEKKIGIELTKRDFDSIERLDDLDGNILDNNNVKLRRPVNRKKYPIDEREDNEKDPKEKKEKTVKCLYYTLMCCECSIS